MLQITLNHVNRVVQASTLRHRVQVDVWSVPLVALALVTVLLRMTLALSAGTTVSQVKRIVLLVRKVSTAQTKALLYAWIVRRVSSDLATVALLFMGAKIVPLVSTAL